MEKFLQRLNGHGIKIKEIVEGVTELGYKQADYKQFPDSWILYFQIIE